MSVLYQALQRREQSEAVAARPVTALPPPRPFSIVPPAPAPAYPWQRFTTAFLLIVSCGLAALLILQQQKNNQPQIQAVLTPPVVTEAVRPDDTDHVQVNDIAPVAMQDIATIASMLPPAVQEQPLPVRVGTGTGAAAQDARARRLQIQGAKTAAMAAYDRAGGSYSSQVNRWGLVAEKNPHAALMPLQELVRDYPRLPAAPAQLGIVLIRLGDVNGARAMLEKAASLSPELSPESAQIWYNLAILYDQQQQKTAAISAYEKALRGAVVFDGQTALDATVIQRRLSYLQSRP